MTNCTNHDLPGPVLGAAAAVLSRGTATPDEGQEWNPDRFGLMLLTLAGEPAPPLPQIPGRLHRALDDEPAAPSITDELRAAAGWIRPGHREPRP
jgi:hypothetical protein